MDNCPSELIIRRYCCLYQHCTKYFTTKFNLRRHIELTHFQLKDYMCSLCSKAFASKQLLSDHFNTHTGERPFNCETCGSSFKNSSRFSFHKRQHKKNGTSLGQFHKKKRTTEHLEFVFRNSGPGLLHSSESRSELQLPPLTNSVSLCVQLPSFDELKINKVKN